MRAKNEYKFIAEAYDTKLLLERIVDGTLMCPEACCGAPVIECTCGKDCPHCNCFMIHKAMKSKGFTNKLLKEFYKMRDPDGDGSWPDDEREEERRKNPDYGEPEYQDTDGEYGEDNEETQQKFKIYFTTALNPEPEDAEGWISHGTDKEDAWDNLHAYFKNIPQGPGHRGRNQMLFYKVQIEPYEEGDPCSTAMGPCEDITVKSEDAEEIDIGTMVTWNQDGPKKGEVVDVDVEQGFAVIETGFADGRWVVDLGELTKAIPRKPRPLGYPTEDNEEPRRGISGYEHKPDALVSARQAGAKHKPYVSSFVSDGGKIFGVMGSDGKIVHKTRDKQKAYKWFRDNYDNI